MTTIVRTVCAVAIFAVSSGCKTATIPRNDSVKRSISRIMTIKKPSKRNGIEN